MLSQYSEASQRTSCCRESDSSRWPAPYFGMPSKIARRCKLNALHACIRLSKTAACWCLYAQGRKGLAACPRSGDL